MGKKHRNKKHKHHPGQSTGLSEHKRDGSILLPPFRQLPRMMPASWKDDRLPEMLWGILLTGNLEREEALSIFRRVGRFVEGNEKLFDITHTGLTSWSEEERREFITLLKESGPTTHKILQTLVIFPSLPAHKDWREILGEPENQEIATDYLVKAVANNLEQRSREATDCRWVKVLCALLTGKMQMPWEMAERILGYPDFGDEAHAGGLIRSSEMAALINEEEGKIKVPEWPAKFWSACLRSTFCAPLPRKEQRKDTVRITSSQIHRIRHILLLHYMKTDKSSAIEPRHDTIFGFGFYALRLLNELVVTNLSRGAIGRLTLRTLVESRITLAYLLKKDDPNLWKTFRDYGIGQMKLSYLKARDSSDKPAFIDAEFVQRMANEDRWEEFSDIELSQWASSDLRKMSEEAGCKEIYDAYYSWSSTFSHGSWGAIRETSFNMCANPLHRGHLIPTVEVYSLPGVLDDAVKMANSLLSLINTQYPGLDCELVDEPKSKSESKITEWFKYWYSRIRYHKTYKFINFITGGKFKE